jgi:arginyl-tRNA synthetase
MNPRIDLQIQELASSCVAELFGAQLESSSVSVQNTRKEFAGDRTVVCFPLTRHSKLAPEATGNKLGEAMVSSASWLTGFNVVKGFLNLEVAPSYWTQWLEGDAAAADYGSAPKGSAPQVMVEYSSPNTNKPLHLGHLRNNFLGHSVARILEAAGHDVVKVQIINDRGIHICKSMVAWQQLGNGETPESTGEKGDHFVGRYYVAFDKAFKAEVAGLVATGMDVKQAEAEAPILQAARTSLKKWEDNDQETVALWKRMNSWVYKGFETTYATMGVDFDKLYYESNTYLVGKDKVLQGVADGLFTQREDGSVWVDLTGDGLDEKILLRSDGTAVYMTQDIGTAILRFEDYPGLDRQIYTVGNEQEYHFKVLFLVLEKLGFGKLGKNHHLSYGMVELPEGKMKSREGTVVDADDLMDEMSRVAEQIATESGKIEGLDPSERQSVFAKVGLGALKYFLLKVDPTKGMMFDPKASIDFIGNTAPFIQFNYVRGKSILRKADEQRLPPAAISPVGPDEMELIQLIYAMPDIISEAASSYNPGLVANWCYDLTKSYSSYYQDHPMLSADNASDGALRLMLTARFTAAIKKGFHLLGIDMPERM